MQDDLLYEQLQDADAATVEAIVGLYRSAGWWDESSAEDARGRAVIPEMVRGSFCFLVARDVDGRIVAMARAISDRVSDAYIQDVVVLPEWRGRGIGAEMVRRLARFCSERRLAWIGLVAEPGTQAFYEALGFRALEQYVPMRFRGPAEPPAASGSSAAAVARPPADGAASPRTEPAP